MHRPKYHFHLDLKSTPAQNYPGDWTGRQRGKGYEFWQLREYQQGDSVSLIDWKAKARTRRLFVREFLQETFYSLILVCDVSSSMFFGNKFRFMQDIATSLAYAAIKDNNPCGLLLYANQIEAYLKPRAEYSQFFRINKTILDASKPRKKKAAIQPVMQYLHNVLPSSLVIFLSDFILEASQTRLLQKGGQNFGLGRHELVAFHLLEDIEYKLPEKVDGLVCLQDIESGKTMHLDLSRDREYAQGMKSRLEKIKRHLFQMGIESLAIKTGDQDLELKVNSFFDRRAQSSR